jgi:hypothetical protein
LATDLVGVLDAAAVVGVLDAGAVVELAVLVPELHAAREQTARAQTAVAVRKVLGMVSHL